MSRDKQITHKGSILLSHDENLKVFSLIESKCVALATSIVQLYITKQPEHSYWIKRGAGALCIIRDCHKRSHFLRLYCTVKDRMIWEEELYTTITFNRVRPYLLTFEGHINNVAINFASEVEAQDFNDHLVDYANHLARRIKHRSADQVKPSARNVIKPGYLHFNIGCPSNIEHVAHIGFDQDRVIDVRGGTIIINQVLMIPGIYDAPTTDREPNSADNFKLKTKKKTKTKKN